MYLHDPYWDITTEGTVTITTLFSSNRRNAYGRKRPAWAPVKNQEEDGGNGTGMLRTPSLHGHFYPVVWDSESGQSPLWESVVASQPPTLPNLGISVGTCVWDHLNGRGTDYCWHGRKEH